MRSKWCNRLFLNLFKEGRIRMSTKIRRILAVLMAAVMIIGLGTAGYAAETMYTVKGNNTPDGKYYEYDNLSNVMFDLGSLDAYATDDPTGPFAGIVTPGISGTQSNWSSTRPVSFIFVKVGNDAIANPQLQTNNDSGNKFGYLFKYDPAQTSGVINLSGTGISHMVFYFSSIPTTGEIKVIKTLSGDPNPPTQPFTFNLYKASDLVNPFKSLTISGAGWDVFKELPFGDYVVKEDDTNLGDFSLTSTNSLPIALGLDNLKPEVTFNNKYTEKTYEISIKKSVTGDEFDTDQMFNFELLKKNTTTVVATASLKAGETKAFSPKVPVGDYFIREVDVPTGFTPQGNVDVLKAQVITEPTIEYSNTYDDNKFNVSVEKFIKGDLPDPAIPFVFDLFKVTYVEDEMVPERKDTVTIYNQGIDYFDAVEPGEYFVKERDPGVNFEVTGDNENHFILGPINDNGAVESFNAKITNTVLKYEINVYKEVFIDFIYDEVNEYDNEMPLFVKAVDEPGMFTFELWNYDDVNNPFLVETITLDPWENKSFAPVFAGVYRVKEVNMPDHYKQYVFEGEEAIPEVILGPNNPDEYLTFFNQKLFDISVEKTLTDRAPSNATFGFSLYREEGEIDTLIQTISITGEGTKAFDPVPAGEYYVREVNIPSGYFLTEPGVRIAEVNSDFASVVVEFENDYEQTTTSTTAGTTEGSTETTEVTTEVTTEETTEVTTEVTTESTEDITEETIPEAAPTEELVELFEEDTPLASSLPQTGQFPAELYYGIGGLISAAGVFMKKFRR